MGLLFQIVVMYTLSNLLFAPTAGSMSNSAMRKVSEESQSNFLLLQVIDLIKEVKDLKGLLWVQSGKIEHTLEEIEEIKSKLGEKNDLKDTIENMESRLVQNIDDMKKRLVENNDDMDLKVTKLGSKIEVMRSEVRLISQQKLTWQNDTFQSKWFSDYGVDGVYTFSNDEYKSNPIAHSGTDNKNNMFIIDLGGLFKIHTVKVWLRARTDCCHDQSMGVMIYADEELIGVITEFKYLLNFQAKDKVYGRKIYLKNTFTRHIVLREVQVFGSGPYHKDELE